MASFAFGKDSLNKFPTKEQLDALDDPPPLPMEPIILDSEEDNSTKTSKSTDDKSTK